MSLDTPKPLMPLWGQPVVGRLLEILAGWGVKEVLLNLHFNPTPLCTYLKKESPAGMRISLSFEPEILGTGGALRRAGWFLDADPFWMVNADIAAVLEPRRILREFARRHPIAALWVERERGPRTVEIRRGNIVNFQTSRPGTEGTYTFCGLQLISPALLKYLPGESFCSIIQAYQNAIRDGKNVCGVCVPGSYWADLGTPESYLQAHAEIIAAHRKKLPGRTLFNPGRTQPAASLQKKGILIKGFAVIDKTAEIRPGARIENAVIWPRAVVGPKAIVKDAVVGAECAVNARVPRLAAKTPLRGQSPDIQLNLALARLGLDPSRTVIMPFEPRGSARSFTRISGAGKKSCIMVRYSRERHENCLYARQTVFLKKLGLNTPALIADFPERQFMLMQDLGDVSLQQIAADCHPKQLARYYRRVLQAVLVLHEQGAAKARRIRLEMTAPFSPDLYLWERDFFVRFFLAPYLRPGRAGIKTVLDELTAVGEILNRERRVLIHRDLQSSNILFFRRRPYFIDFQGMRFGPAAYDLASLLCDPYVNLPVSLQISLLDFYNRHADKKAQISPDIFWLGSVQRLCQALGAYGRLAARGETARFAQYIPPAARMMRRALERSGMCPRLYEVIAT